MQSSFLLDSRLDNFNTLSPPKLELELGLEQYQLQRLGHLPPHLLIVEQL
jgi:hypothetical protein